MEFIINSTDSFTEEEKKQFILLLREQKQTIVPELSFINDRCYYLGFAYDDKRLIGIGAIKKRRILPFVKSGYKQLIEDYNYELGYLYVKREYRNKEIGLTLSEMLCSKIDENIYSTCSNDNASMIVILKSLGFICIGESWEGYTTHKNLSLFVKEKK